MAQSRSRSVRVVVVGAVGAVVVAAGAVVVVDDGMMQVSSSCECEDGDGSNT